MPKPAEPLRRPDFPLRRWALLTTRFTELVGCTTPIQQAPIGAAAPPELAAAVSNAGGLGTVATALPGGTSVAGLGLLIERTRRLTSRPFCVNFVVAAEFMPPIERGCFELAAGAARVVDLFLWAPPDRDVFDLIHRGGALVACQIGSREEASAAVDAGCDLIIAQSFEAGGHVRGKIGLLPLLAEVLDAVDVPVLAAGGIGTGRAVAAALAAGADGVRVGTRFVAAEEANAHPVYVEALIAARAQDTVYTEAFSVGWPNAPHRVLRASLAAAEAFRGDFVGERPSVDGRLVAWPRFSIGTATRAATGAIEATAHWAGESVSAVKRVQPAAEIVRELTQEAEELLRRW